MSRKNRKLKGKIGTSLNGSMIQCDPAGPQRLIKKKKRGKIKWVALPGKKKATAPPIKPTPKYDAAIEAKQRRLAAQEATKTKFEMNPIEDDDEENDLDKEPETPWIVMGDNCIKCLHCGETQNLGLPMRIPVFLALGKAYRKEHRDCKPREKEPTT